MWQLKSKVTKVCPWHIGTENKGYVEKDASIAAENSFGIHVCVCLLVWHFPRDKMRSSADHEKLFSDAFVICISD